jgi:hypothetical protein
MSAFEFYISFYGLLLGLSVAEVANGALNTIGSRRAVAIGWLTPLLASFIFLDISSFWIYAWGIRETLTVGWATMFAALFVALSYYLAAGLIFPRDITQWTSLDEHYWQHKRWVIAGVLLANIVVFGQTLSVRVPNFDFAFWFGQVTYWPPLIALLLSRNAKLDFAALGVGILGYLALTILPGATFGTGA